MNTQSLTTKMIIMAGGQVGVGTAKPSRKLHVAGSGADTETEGLGVSDFVIRQINQQLGDGALHGLWVKFDLETEIAKTLQAHPELLASLPQPTNGSSVALPDLQDMVVHGALTVYGP